eukprot:TRINITY_DN614_c0_g2_i6.p1 TRINITY_DN614_c0_g2~~TRINITY_DN614_c0_g2_i6.p1  ORF type:complete len:121 (+),score=5.74 TRINITY_DN614_c0_g2_i6:51-413(+)
MFHILVLKLYNVDSSYNLVALVYGNVSALAYEDICALAYEDICALASVDLVIHGVGNKTVLVDGLDAFGDDNEKSIVVGCCVANILTSWKRSSDCCLKSEEFSLFYMESNHVYNYCEQNY